MTRLHAAQQAAWARWEARCPEAEYAAFRARLQAWPRDEAAWERFQSLRVAYQATSEFQAACALRERLTQAIERPLWGSFARGAPDLESALAYLAAPEPAWGLCYTRRRLVDRLRRMALDPATQEALRALAFAGIERREYGHCRGVIVAYRRLLRGIAVADDVRRLRALAAGESRYVADKAARALAVVLQGRPELRGVL
ncbi:MAG: hypothetical protein R3B09_07720 [Nannocystaceae bacterium]